MTTSEKSTPSPPTDRARPQNVTIHDVARHSGVSYQTVSRVINNHANVAQHTRARVLQTIQELNYRPSLLAKGLVTRRSQLIGVVAHGMNQYGPSQILQNVQESAHEVGYEVMLTTLQQVDLEQVQEKDVLTAARRLQQFGVDGLVLLTNYDAHDIAHGLSGSLPFVMIDATSRVRPSASTSSAARPAPPGTWPRWATGDCCTSAARPAGATRNCAARASGVSCSRAAWRSCPPTMVTGVPRAVTRPRCARWMTAWTSRGSSPATTRWRWAC